MTKFRSSNNPRSSTKFRTHAPDTGTFTDLTCDSITAESIACDSITDATSIELAAPTVIINGGFGDCKLQIKADSDNAGENDNPTIELIQDGTDVNSTLGCGGRLGQSNANALIINNSIPSGAQFTATGGIVFKTGRTGDITTTTERLVIDPDGDTNVLGDLNISDSKSIFLGASQDLQLIHDTNHSYLDEQGSGDLRIRSNASNITLHSTTSATTGNFMARFLSGGAAELYHDNVLRMSTTEGGILVGNEFAHDDSNLSFTTSSAQLAIGGTHNSGQPSGNPTVKLLITGTDNDDSPPIDYHAVFVDENGQIDFSAKASYASGDNSAEFQFRGGILNNWNTVNAAGAGFSDAIVSTNIRKVDNEIITTILVDLDEGPMAAQTAGKIIGKSGSSDTCHLTQVTAAKNGYVYKAEMCCIEAPNAAANLDLVYASSAQTPGSNTLTVLIDGAVHNRGNCEQVLFDNVNIDTKFLHLATGATDGTADYTAGKFIIKLYGANF